MIKFKVLALIAAGAFAASSTFAGDKGHCATTVGNEAKHACSMSFANLNLTAEQKPKMEKLAAECGKGGCTKESMTKMNNEAEEILTKEQFATWKASHDGEKKSEKTQS